MPPGYGPDETAMSRAIGQPVDQRGGMFTRNLIGSLAASAFKLHDTDDRLGIWFILQDLSVRTEGAFRYVRKYTKSSHAANSIMIA